VRALAAAVFVLALGVYLEFAWPPFYDFPPPRPFSGDVWYQPYAGYRGGGLVGNFHAHAGVWGGLTAGEVTREELHAMYLEHGHDVIGISDYMSIAPPQGADALYLSAYEHGYTVGRRHQTVIGAERVDWFDYPLGGNVRQKQHVIDRLRAGAPFLVLNHPTKAGSYAFGDFEKLAGYDALEVATKYGIWDDFWDAALSAGRPVWGMAADDGHTQRTGGGSHLGIAAVVIQAAERTPEAVLAALRAGRFHSLYMRQNEPPIALVRAEIEDGELVVEIGETAQVIRFISAHGAIRREERGRSIGRYRLAARDPYVRVEVIAHGAVLYLNPVIRWDGVALPAPRAELRPLPTWTVRGLGALALAWLARALIRALRRRRSGTAGSPDRAPAPRAAPEREAARAADRS
jgi:hypothetical protein